LIDPLARTAEKKGRRKERRVERGGAGGNGCGGMTIARSRVANKLILLFHGFWTKDNWKWAKSEELAMPEGEGGKANKMLRARVPGG